MPGPLKLLDAFQKGELKKIKLKDAEKYYPDLDKKCMLLHGWIWASDTANIALDIVDAKGINTEPILQFVVVSGPKFPIFSTLPSTKSYTEVQNCANFIIIDGERKDGFMFNSDSAIDFCELWVLEW